MGACFQVRTDHYSLKYLLDQRLSTNLQHQWLSKLFGFDFAVEYRPGRLNAAADALSRCDSESSSDDAAELQAISGPSFDLLDDIRAATSTDEEAAQLLEGGSTRMQGSFSTASTSSCLPSTTSASECSLWSIQLRPEDPATSSRRLLHPP